MIVVGTLLLLAAVSLVVFNWRVASSAAEGVKDKVVSLQEYIREQPPIVEDSSLSDNSSHAESETDDSSQPELVIPEEEEYEALDLDGNFYCGLLTIPKLDLELPVIRDYAFSNMSIAPTRYAGSIGRRDMIICAHNYAGFFLYLDRLQQGDEIIYTTLRGRQIHYTVGWFELIAGYDSGSMLAGSDGWDLTLFTCTWSGWSRVTARCVLA